MIIVLLLLLTAAAVVAPLVTLWRVLSLQKEVAALRQRISALEATPRRDAAPTAAVTAVRAIDPRAPSVLVPAVPAAAPAAAPAEDEDATELERQIGGGLLLYAGVIVLVLGVAFFLRYAFEQQWISPAVRVALGVGVGLALTAGGTLTARRYRFYGLLLAGGGLAVLYLAGYAALNLYGLVSATVAFTYLVLVSIAAGVLADQTRSLPLAALAVGGGFVTPFLVGGRQDAQITLFSYDALLIAATMLLARRRDWPWLNVASLALTFITVSAWADTFYTPGRYLTTELFLTLYCAMFVAMLEGTRGSAHRDAPLAAAVLGAAPVGYHAASVMILWPHGIAVPVYLILFTAAAVIAGLQHRMPWLRLAGWLAAMLPLIGWAGEHRGRTWLVVKVATVLTVYAFHLSAQARVLLLERRFRAPDVVLLHASGVGLFAGLYVALFGVASETQLAAVAVACAGVSAALAWCVNRAAPASGPGLRDPAIHWLAVAFTLVAIAVAIRFDGPWGVIMWAAEGAAVLWVARLSERVWLRGAAWALIGLAIARWLRPDVQVPGDGFTPLLNARALSALFIVGVLYAVAWLERGGDVASDRSVRHERAALLVGASALTIFAASREIVSFWDLREGAAGASFAREVMLSGAWAAYAAVLVAVGIRRHYAPIRYFAIVLFGITLTKVFAVDLGTLGGVYRIAGFVVVGVILLAVSFLYQRRQAPRPQDRGSG